MPENVGALLAAPADGAGMGDVGAPLAAPVGGLGGAIVPGRAIPAPTSLG